MNIIKQILKKTDVFGVPFFFKYENNNKYSSPLGGLFFIIFCISIVIILGYNFSPFIKRKNYSLIYYSISMSNTEEIKLEESDQLLQLDLIVQMIQMEQKQLIY